jgi:hypothetical protein
VLSGDTLAVGNAFSQILVLVDGPSGWVNEATFGPPLDSTSYYGESLAIDGDTIVTSNPWVAYVFHRAGSQWTREAALQPTPGYSTSAFGWSVAVSGEYVAVGDQCRRGLRRRWCPDNPLGTLTGSAYVFRRDGGAWPQIAKVWPSDHQIENYANVFGRTIDISGTTMLVGAKNISSAYFYDLTKLPTVQPGEVLGVVTDATTKAPIGGVTVTLMLDHPHWVIVATTTSDAMGRFRFGDVAPGPYRVRFFDASGKHPRTWWSSTVSYREAGTLVVTGGAAAIANQALTTASGAIGGHVFAGQVGATVPLANIRVRVFDHAAGYVAGATTGPDGFYEIRSLPPGTYLVQFVDPSRAHRPQWHGFATTAAAAARIDVVDGAKAWASGWMGPISP